MKKISVNKSDEVAIIVEKIIDVHDSEVVLSIPRFSHLGESLSNFHLLKREAEALEKKIIIESVDDHIVELAEMSGLTAVNPFFAKNKRQFADIVRTNKSVKTLKKKKPIVRIFQSEEPEKAIDEEFAALENDLEEEHIKRKQFFRLPKLSLPKISFPELNSQFLIVSGGIVVAGILFFLGVKVLPRAKVTIAAQTQNWEYNDAIATDKSASLDIIKMAMPNQVFSQKKNAQLKFPATGKKQIQKKATGTMTVYNSYSSDPQPLVGQTRFMSPDGKIYRLIKNIIVPAAKIIEGRIAPSSIDAEVVSDAAGADYNIGPVKLFTIPGFKGSPKYQAFYGESKGNMDGGFIGEVAYPTGSDIKSAKEKAESALESGLATAFLAQIPKEFKVLDGAKKYKILDEKIDQEADKDGSFGIFAESQMAVIGFKEEDLKMLLDKRAKHDNGEDFDIRSSELSYGLARADFDKGALSFPVNFKAVLARHIDAEDLKNKIAGKSEMELKTMVFGLPGLKSATISLWPFWVKTVPNSIDKISVIVE